MEFKEVHKGIDSLYLSFRGNLKEDILEELEEKKLFAQSESEKANILAVMLFEDHCFEVRDKGRGRYKYVLVDNWYQIQIAGNLKNKIPDIYTQVSSELLNCAGVEKAFSDLKKIVPHLAGETNNGNISRADLFVDFVTDCDFSEIKKPSWIMRGHRTDMHWDKSTFTGWSIGLGGVVSARLYNKSVEIEKTGKHFFKEIWKKNGWKEGETVWRLEFQIKRDCLKDLTATSVEHFMASVNDVWRYCTHEWLKLAIDDGTENRSRWKLHEFWLNIQEVLFGDGSFTGISRYVDKTRTPEESLLFQNGMGYIISYAALKDIKNIDDAVMQFYKSALKYIEGQAKSSGNYKDSNDYIKTKFDLKQRQYNIKPE